MSCAEAVPCYIKALELKPQYVRALSNLGISYGNMANYEAAAQCYLKALSLNSEAVHLWGYLTMTFTSMGRQDLLSKASGANVDAFRPDFDFNHRSWEPHATVRVVSSCVLDGVIGDGNLSRTQDEPKPYET